MGKSELEAEALNRKWLLAAIITARTVDRLSFLASLIVADKADGLEYTHDAEYMQSIRAAYKTRYELITQDASSETRTNNSERTVLTATGCDAGQVRTQEDS